MTRDNVIQFLNFTYTCAKMTAQDEIQIQDEIAQLESRLHEAKARLSALGASNPAIPCKSTRLIMY